MDVQSTNPLTASIFVNFLQQANGANGSHGYLYKHPQKNEYAIFFRSKTETIPGKGYAPLTLREITILGLQIKDDIKKNPAKAQTVVQELQRMSEIKKAQEMQRYRIVRLASHMRDCLSNYWQGLGFRSSTTIAEEFSLELAKKPLPPSSVAVTDEMIRAKPQPPAPQIPQPAAIEPPVEQATLLPATPEPSKAQTLPKAHPERPVLQRKITNGKARALNAYKTNQAKCGAMLKSIIFKDIKSIDAKGTQDIISVVQLMEYVSSLSPYDLQDEKCGGVVLDTLRECNKETSDQLCEWLLKEETFHPDLLLNCLAILIEKEGLRKVVSLFAIENFLKIFAFNSWNESHPVNHPTIVAAMTVLLISDPNNDRVGVLLDWMIRQPEFTLETFAKLVTIFKDKEEFFLHKSLFYPARDRLLDHFKATPNWRATVFFEQKHSFAMIAGYLRKKGIYASEEEKIHIESSSPFLKEETTAPEIKPKPRIAQAKIEHAVLKRRSTTGKSRALQLYKNNPFECITGPKSIIFKDIKFIDPPTPRLDDNEIVSVVHLIKYMAKAQTVHLHDPIASQVIIDTFAICDKETADRLAEWLLQEKTLHPKLLLQCFEVFLLKKRASAPISFFALEMLFKQFVCSKWNRIYDGENRLLYPVNRLDIISTLTILLENAPNDDKIGSYLDWIIDQPEFDAHSFCRLLLVFRDKERELKISRIFYPNRDKLIACLNRFPIWTKDLALDTSEIAEETIDYICELK